MTSGSLEAHFWIRFLHKLLAFVVRTLLRLFSLLNLLHLIPFLACLAQFAGPAGLPWLALLACLSLLAGGAGRVRTLAPRSVAGFDIGIDCLGSLSEFNFSSRFQNEL